MLFAESCFLVFPNFCLP